MKVNQSYLYPVLKDKSDLNNRFVFNIEGIEVKVEKNIKDGSVLISANNQEIAKLNKKEAKKKTELNVEKHKIKVQDLNGSDSIFSILRGFNTGFCIWVDDKPLEGSSADPMLKIKLASYALYFFAGFALLTVLLNRTLGSAVTGVILILLGLSTKKYPVFTLTLGSLYSVAEIILQCLRFLTTSHTGTPIMAIFFLIFKIGLTVTVIRGLTTALKLRSMKRKLLLQQLLSPAQTSTTESSRIVSYEQTMKLLQMGLNNKGGKMNSVSETIKQQTHSDVPKNIFKRVIIGLILIGIAAGIFYLIFHSNSEPEFNKSFRNNFITYALLTREMYDNNEKRLNWGEFSSVSETLLNRTIALRNEHMLLNPKRPGNKEVWKKLSFAIDAFLRVLSLRNEFFQRANMYVENEMKTDNMILTSYDNNDVILDILNNLEKESSTIDSIFIESYGEVIDISDDYNIILPPIESFELVSAIKGWTETWVNHVREIKTKNKREKEKEKEKEEKPKIKKRDIVHIGDSKETVKRILGNPMSVRDWRAGEEWVYDDYGFKCIQFRSEGTVYGSSGITIDPLPRNE